MPLCDSFSSSPQHQGYTLTFCAPAPITATHLLKPPPTRPNMESFSFKTHPEPQSGATDPESNLKTSESVGDVSVTPPIFIYTQSAGLHSHWLSVPWLRQQEALLESSVRSRPAAFFLFFFFCLRSSFGIRLSALCECLYFTAYVYKFGFFSLSVRLKPEHPCREGTALQQGRIRSREVNNKYSALGVAYD